MRATLVQLRHEPDVYLNTDFHAEHRQADPRWSHAKVYSFKRGTARRLLVTSANFSPAAWGKQNEDDELIIENFELGVCIEQAAWPFDGLEPFDSAQDAATVPELPSRGSAFIMWARAVWDGNKVDVDCRCETDRELAGALQCGAEWTPITNWAIDADGRLRSAQVPWADSKRSPLLVRLTCEQESVSVPIFDARASREREDTIPLEVDEDVAQRMRDELLFEQYGGRVAADAEGESPTDCDDGLGDDDGDGPGHLDSYSIPAFVLARRHLGVVDNWADQVKRTPMRGTGEFEREVIRRDGELLIEAFNRQVDRDGKNGSGWAIGAKLAAEELALRLKDFQEA
jgi:Tyrosyl-DNA phosphodiesterase